ncbi:MAG: hypothetical protein ACFB50_18780 [Rubrobacteraceae bacterium]
MLSFSGFECTVYSYIPARRVLFGERGFAARLRSGLGLRTSGFRGEQQVMFPWTGTSEERMVSEIGDELAVYRKRCETLHDEFRQRLQVRDTARSTLSEAEKNISAIQMEGVALVGNLNAAMGEGNEEKIKDLERGYKKNNRDLVRAQKTRDVAARRLEEVEVDDDQAVSKLKQDVLKVLDEYAERIRERKQILTGFMETLDKNQEALARDTAPLTGGYEPRNQREGLPETDDRKA